VSWRRWLAALGAAGAIVLALAAPAGAHALVTGASPAPGSNVRQAPAQIVLTFTERPDANLSSIKVLDTSGQTRAGGKPTPVPGRPTQLFIAVHGLKDGVYTVAWRTVSAVDGHLASGSFAFGVNVTPTGTAASRTGTVQSPRPGNLAVAARWVFFVGVMGLAGGALVGLVVLDEPSPVMGFLLPLSCAVALAGIAGITKAQLSAAGLGIGDTFRSSIGHSLLLRAVPILALAVVLAAARRFKRAKPLLGIVAVLAVLTMVGDADTSHAAAGSSWTWLKVGIQSVHFLAASAWIGGLTALLVSLRRVPAERRGAVVRRYSRLAAYGLLVVATTGVLRAIDEVGTWHQLLNTGFGQAIDVKVGLLAVIAALGAVNRYRHVTRADRSVSGLRRVARAEIAVALVVLGATAILQNLAPAKIAAASASAFKPVVLRAHDFATTVKVSLTVDPATAGFNQFTLKVADFDTGKPVAADKVSLGFHLPARPDIGDSTLVLTPAGAGTYGASGGNLSVQGTWTITALIQRAGTGTEIPLTLTTQSQPPRIQVQRSAGLPDFYNLTLAGGTQIQVYLDPGRAGFNQFHATYLDPNGAPLPITGFSVTQVPAGSSAAAQALTTRPLDVGHYVADSTVQKGRYVYTLTATTADGTPITVPVTITVH
jgi:putative copper export protein/methionine-rich copper-binding protein CopC/nitrogen fixation protein FixH